MEQVLCNCSKCAQHLGRFLNLWTKIGKSYISPIVQAEGPLNVVASGETRLGETQTLVDGCQLQDIQCAECSAIVGLTCSDTPVNHVLHAGQLLLRISSILIANTNDNSPVTASILRTLKLREAPSNGNDSDFIHLLTDLDAQRDEIQRLDGAGCQIVATFNHAIRRVDADVQKLRDGMAELQRSLAKDHAKTADVEEDLKMLKTGLMEVRKIAQDKSPRERFENEISTTKQSIASMRLSLNGKLDNTAAEQRQQYDTISSDLENVCQDLNDLRKELDETKNAAKENGPTPKAHAKEVASLKAELKQLKDELARERSQKSSSSNPIFPSREIDILTSNITKIGQRASQVETLQMEFDLLKGRVQRIEAQKGTDVDFQDMGPLKYRPETFGHKRSPNSRLDNSMDSEATSAMPSMKRPALDGWSSSPTRRYDSRSSLSSTRTSGVDARPQRLTKTGMVDKRSLRRGPKSPTAKDRIANG